jgi:4-amino-4-deoxy-L-arabinose transferase-like glycosyltransferase
MGELPAGATTAHLAGEPYAVPSQLVGHSPARDVSRTPSQSLSDSGARAWSVAALVFAAACVFCGLGSWALLNPDEGRNAGVALEMRKAGAWLVPLYNGIPYLDKPAFYFRTVAISLAVFGRTEFAARLPSALFGCALLVMVWAFCRRAYGWRSAALAVVVLATAPMFLGLARMVIFDMALALAIWASLFAAYVAEEDSGSARRMWWLASAVAAATATLIKGPVGFLVPLVVLLVLAAVERRRGVLGRMFSPLNLAVFFALVLAWFIGVSLRRPDFPHYGIVEESLQRFTTSKFNRPGPFYYYVPVILGFFFPWSAILPEAMVAGWRARARALPADRLFGVAAIVVPIFFSISHSKLPQYVLPGIVALGVLVARIFAMAWENPEGRAARLVLRACVIAAVASLALAALLAVDVFHVRALLPAFGVRNAQSLLLRGLFAPLLVALVVLGATAATARALRSCRVAFMGFLLFLPVTMIAGRRELRAYADSVSSRPLAARIEMENPGGDVAMLECFSTGLPFYLDRPVFLVSRDGAETTSNYIVHLIAKTPDEQNWPPTIIAPDRFAAWLAERTTPVFVLARTDRAPDLVALAASHGATVEAIEPGWFGALINGKIHTTKLSPPTERETSSTSAAPMMATASTILNAPAGAR